MGVPAFFRWLSKKYPTIVVHCAEEKSSRIDGEYFPVDTSQPNPNNCEFDNLYLDMNGIIHPCTHPENKPAPKNEAEMFVEIFAYIDRIFAIVRPRKLLYMAIDGVAPRAKMNQQRSRRFRAAQEATEKEEVITRLREELLAKGARLPPKKEDAERFDSNCITPGTPFMSRLATALRYYIHDRLNSDPGWKNILVILSDANAPGEGEHKIMDYIRRQRSQPSHDPNTRHCLCGADADLIMLGLATHEPNFTIIREEFKPNQAKPCELCGQLTHEMKECEGLLTETPPTKVSLGEDVEFIFIRLNVLREYLQRELRMDNLPFPYDFERAVDDWVFMCFFVGNDFLPHLPSLEIREGAIDRLVTIYKNAVYKTGGWLTDSGKVTLSRVHLVMQALGKAEDEIFRRRRNFELNNRRRDQEQKKAASNPCLPLTGQMAPTPLGNRKQVPAPLHGTASDNSQALRAMLKTDEAGNQSTSRALKRKSDALDAEDDEEDEDANDEVRLWENGWKDRYYHSKFGVHPEESPDFCHHVAWQYVRGLCWVLLYYYQGCASWTWYFPFHYAPFASDFVGVSDMTVEFEQDTEPFKPLEQLMGVFPAASRSHVPPSWQNLMTNPNSPIIDFYPTDFKVDLNGKRFLWQGVALLPFVDEKRLLDTLKTVQHKLSPEEVARNVRGPDRVFCREDHPSGKFFNSIYEDMRWNKAAEKPVIDPRYTGGISGKVWPDDERLAYPPGKAIISPIPLCPNLARNNALSMCFLDPQVSKGYIFPARLLSTVKMPSPTLKPEGMSKNTPYRPNLGMGEPGSGHRPYSIDMQPINRTINHYTGFNNSQNRGNNESRNSNYSGGGNFSQSNYGRDDNNQFRDEHVMRKSFNDKRNQFSPYSYAGNFQNYNRR